MSRQVTGQLAEQDARAYLEQQGLTWLESNFRCLQGEIDLIMRDQEALVFVEVRYRSDPNFGQSIETISRQKQNRLIKAAEHYLLKKHWVDQYPCRFDVIGLSADGETNWIQNAFEVKY